MEVIPYLDDSTSEDGNNDIGKPAGYINAEEIADRYKQNKKWGHYLTRQKKVPRVQKAGILFYDEKVIEELFSRYASTEGITEWYTTDDIEEIYNKTAVARRSFTHRHNIPTKKEYGITYYSKLHVDFARNPGMQYAEDYYMVEQIMAKYFVDRETVYGIVRYKKIPSSASTTSICSPQISLNSFSEILIWCSLVNSSTLLHSFSVFLIILNYLTLQK